MTNMLPDGATLGTPLRLWPGVAAGVLLVLIRFGVPLVAPEASIIGVLGAVVCAIAIVLWWLFFSKAPWSERIGALVLIAVALVAVKPFVHPSIENGMMGNMLRVYGTPFLTLGLVIGVALSRRWSTGARRVSILAAIALVCGFFTLVRTGGVSGDGNADLHWRWTKAPEDLLLAKTAEEPLSPLPAPVAAPAPAPATVKEPEKAAPAPADVKAVPTTAPAAPIARAEWPGFRGPDRDDVVRGVRIETDWAASPPVEMWRREIGPGWSSFAVAGDLLYTLEQRGNEEVVACYRVSTGAPVWRHRDAARFWESNAGAGPRGTPTIANGRVYSLGATGILNALDARTGSVVWTRNAATDTGAKTPGWGFTSSPLVLDDAVIVAASGRLAAYDAATGARRWSAVPKGGSYSSPHLMTIDGVPQILLLTSTGAISVAVADGKLLWEHAWPGTPILQPAQTGDGGVLITTGDMMGGLGVKRLAIAHGASGWTVQEQWASRGLKPYFNDLVVHKGHAYGFDGGILSSIDLADGARKWKGGRYGHGQLVLLPDQDLLLVLSEEGELALVRAVPDQFTEVARFPAIEGKTWNHPVLVGDRLLVRNAEHMAAFRLPLASR
jgi:outer membrane protein assembly factor BamB